VLGNGRNDAAMLRAAALGIAVIGAEGVAPEVLAASDLLVPGSEAALDLFLKPKRLLAGLRA
jgi:soluble P-type ATPase